MPATPTRMPNERLRQAMISAGVTTKALSRATGVHPRTVQRWLDYHRPPKDRDLREQVGRLLAVDSDYLWPGGSVRETVNEELAGFYPNAQQIPAEVWNSLFYGSNDVAILTDDPALLIDDRRGFLPSLVMRVASGHRVRLMLHDPHDPQLDDDVMVQNVRTVCAELRPLTLAANSRAEIRLHRHRLAQSIFRFGDDMIVIHHTGADTISDEPALHLHRADQQPHQPRIGPEPTSAFAAFTRAFTTAWSRPTPPNPMTDYPEIGALSVQGPPPGMTEEEYLVRSEAYVEIKQRFAQIREALLELDPEPEIRLRLDQILDKLVWFDPDDPTVPTSAEFAAALRAIPGGLGSSEAHRADTTPAQARDPHEPSDHEHRAEEDE